MNPKWRNTSVALVAVVAGTATALSQTERPTVPDVYCTNGQVHLVWDALKYRVIVSGMRCQHDGDDKQPEKKQHLTAQTESKK